MTADEAFDFFSHDIGLIGFSDAEIAGLAVGEMTGLTDPDEVPEVPAEPVSRLGDLWVLGRHRLLCGDSTAAKDVKAVLGNVRPHLMATDPPYGVDYEPSWRKRAGVNLNKAKLGKVANDDRGLARSLESLPGLSRVRLARGASREHGAGLPDGSWLRGAVADHLGEGPLCAEPRALSLAARTRAGTPFEARPRGMVTASNRRSGRSPPGMMAATVTAPRSRSSA